MLLGTSSESSYYQDLHSLKLVRNLQMMQTREFKLARVKIPLASQYIAASAQLQGRVAGSFHSNFQGIDFWKNLLANQVISFARVLLKLASILLLSTEDGDVLYV